MNSAEGNYIIFFDDERVVFLNRAGISDFAQNDGSYSLDPQAGLMMM